jgi:hypothetical protein
MDPGDYYKKPLPPALYTKAERFVWFNWRLLGIAVIVAVLLGFMFFYEEPVDYPPAPYESTSR